MPRDLYLQAGMLSSSKYAFILPSSSSKSSYVLVLLASAGCLQTDAGHNTCLFKSVCLEFAGVDCSASNRLLLSDNSHATFLGHGLSLHPSSWFPTALGGVLAAQAQLAIFVGLGLHLDAEEGVAQHAQQVPRHAAQTHADQQKFTELAQANSSDLQCQHKDVPRQYNLVNTRLTISCIADAF